MPKRNKVANSAKVVGAVGSAVGHSTAHGVSKTMVDPNEFPPLAGGYEIKISTTVPDKIVRHNISDEELDVLCDSSRDELWELRWAALGALLSALPAAMEGLYRYVTSPEGQMGPLTLFQVLIAFVSAAVWLVLTFIVPRKAARSSGKRDEIRARTSQIENTGRGGKAS